jgi:hypothetical protein
MKAIIGPITGRSRPTSLRSGGLALASTCRTIRRCTLCFAATPFDGHVPELVSVRIRSNSSAFALLSLKAVNRCRDSSRRFVRTTNRAQVS